MCRSERSHFPLSVAPSFFIGFMNLPCFALSHKRILYCLYYDFEATYIGTAAAIYLLKKCLNVSAQPLEGLPSNLQVRSELPTSRVSVVSPSGTLNGLDLAVLKTTASIPKRLIDFLTHALRTLNLYRKASILPRIVIETHYKVVDYLVSTKDTQAATKLIDALAQEMVPQGDTFLFERIHTLSQFYRRMRLHRKAAFLSFMLESNQLHLRRMQQHRAAALLRPPASCMAYIKSKNVQFLSNQHCLLAYQLGSSPLTVRRAHDRVVFECRLMETIPRHRAAGAATLVTCSSSLSVSPIILGWPSLQKEILANAADRLCAYIKTEQENLKDASWDQCTLLIGLLFSLLNGWNQCLDESHVEKYVETLKAVSCACPSDQPTPPPSTTLASSLQRLRKCSLNSPSPTPVSPLVIGPLDANWLRSSADLRTLPDIVEIPVNRLPIVRHIRVIGLPNHLLPALLSAEAVNSATPLEESVQPVDKGYKYNSFFLKKPLFITDSLKTQVEFIDWVCNDVCYVEVVFKNELPIELNLRDFALELSCSPSSNSKSETPQGQQNITLMAAQTYVITGSSKDSLYLPQYSGCLFREVGWRLMNDVVDSPTSGQVVIPGKSSIRIVFGVIPPAWMLDTGVEVWTISAISYLLVTFGNFRVYRNLRHSCVREAAYGDVAETVPECGEASEPKVVDSVSGLSVDPIDIAPITDASLPPLRICPPLPRLCLLLGPCASQKFVDNPTEDSQRMDNVSPGGDITSQFEMDEAGVWSDFTSSVLVTNRNLKHESKKNFCDIVIHLHPYETRWLPLKLFALENACPSGAVGVSSSHSTGLLNVLHFSLQSTSSTNDFLQSRGLLLGQFLQCLGVETIKAKMPLKLRSLEAPKHCCVKDQTEAGYCGQLWLKTDSGAFWDWWLQTANSTQCPGHQTLTAQLCIEFASNVGSVSIQEVSAVGRRVRLGIQLHFLPAFFAPIRVTHHRLVCGTNGIFHEAAESPPNLSKDSCFFRFQLEMVTPQQGKALPPPNACCRFYRVEVDLELMWCGVSLLNKSPLTIATPWQPFMSPVSATSTPSAKDLESLVTGLQPSGSPESLPTSAGMLILLKKLQDPLLATVFPIVVPCRPTDEFYLPIPLPHSLGRLLENFIEVHWTSHVAFSVTGPSDSPGGAKLYRFTNCRFGRIVPLSTAQKMDAIAPEPRLVSSSSQWYFPFLKTPSFVAKLVWGESIWLGLSHSSVRPVFEGSQCPDCCELSAKLENPESSILLSPSPGDDPILHVSVRQLDLLPVELRGGIQHIEQLGHMHRRLLRQFSQQTDSKEKRCINAAEETVRLAHLQAFEQGLVLYRLWMGLGVYQLDEKLQLATGNALSDGATFFINGPAKGQRGLFVDDVCEHEGGGNEAGSPFRASTRSLTGSIVFLRTGHFLVRGLIGLLPLGQRLTESPATLANTCEPIKFSRQTFCFHVRPL
uniref:Trafficking protein particle complex subunit 9 n=1 Tax=Schistocephalus solidus TaxID=70667 RepID=A0A0X3PJW7_SCHSO